MSTITVQTGLRRQEDGVYDAVRGIFHGDEPHEDIGIIIPVTALDQLDKVVNESKLNDNDSAVRALTIGWPGGLDDAATVTFEIDPEETS